ncbi:MAG: ribonuclease HI family protein [Actinomycetota bacterium]
MRYEYLKAYIDGGSRGNPGPSAVGVVIYDDKGNKIGEISKYIGENTNNIAEYRALEEALKALEKYDTKKVVFITDSKLLYNQLKKIWKIKDKNLLKVYLNINKNLSKYELVDLRLVPRKENQEADSLVNKALDKKELTYEGEEEVNFGAIEE